MTSPRAIPAPTPHDLSQAWVRLTTKVVMIDENWRRVPMVLTKTAAGWVETPQEAGKC